MGMWRMAPGTTEVAALQKEHYPMARAITMGEPGNIKIADSK